MAKEEDQNNASKASEEVTSYEHLVDLCERGMLYEAEEWLKDGHATKQPDKSTDCPLRCAVERGFHSLVKLLLRYECTDDQKLHALEVAAGDGNIDLCRLLVDAGAPVNRLRYEHLDYVIRRQLIEYLLDHGLDLNRDNGLAHMFVYRRVKPLLGIYLQHRKRFPEWDEQAAIALCEFVRNGDKKWISLMIWAGADPFRSVTELSEEADDSDEEDTWRQSAVKWAAWSDDPEIMRLLKIDPSSEQASEILFDIWHRPSLSNVEFLLDAGAEVNTYSEEEGSLLHKALRSFSARDDYWTPKMTEEEEVELIARLIRMGATWKLPEWESALGSLRKQMYRQKGRYVVEIIRLLHAGKCCDLSRLQEFVDKPKMRGWVRNLDPKLYRDLGFGG